MLIREDNVVVVIFSNNSMLTIHRDGTKFFTSADRKQITIEH